MPRFQLPAFYVVIAAVSMPLSGGFGEDAPSGISLSSTSPAPAQSPSVSAIVEQQEKRDTIEHRATDLRRQVSDLQGLVAQVTQLVAQRKARNPPSADSGEQPAASNAPEPQAANLRQQDIELHSELQGLIAELERELELVMQSPLPSGAAERQERQAARDALKHVLVDLRQQDAELEELIGGRALASAQRDAQGAPAAANLGEPPRGRDLLERQAADMREQISDLQRQNDALQRQLAQRQQELAQRTEELAQRVHDLEAARAEAEKLWEVFGCTKASASSEAAHARPASVAVHTDPSAAPAGSHVAIHYAAAAICTPVALNGTA
jgi:hypothetical protein